MLQQKTQTFNDGIVKIYKSQHTGLELLQSLRYQERVVGYNRFFKAMERDIKIDLVLRCPQVQGLFEKDTDLLVAVLQNEMYYKIIQIQHHTDVEPHVMDMTLAKVSEYSDLTIGSYAQFNSEIDVYCAEEYENELGETAYRYLKTESIWAQITAENGTTIDGLANTETIEITHKFVVRAADIEIEANMYFIFEGNRYDIKHFMPNYKYKDIIEVFCVMVVE